MLMLHTPWQIPQCPKESTSIWILQHSYLEGTYMAYVHLCTLYDNEKCSPAQYSIQFQHCLSNWNACSHATWFFNHGSSHLGIYHIWRQPSCQHGQSSCKMHFTSNNKFKDLSDKMFLNWLSRGGSRFHPTSGNLLTPFDVLCLGE